MDSQMVEQEDYFNGSESLDQYNIYNTMENYYYCFMNLKQGATYLLLECNIYQFEQNSHKIILSRVHTISDYQNESSFSSRAFFNVTVFMGF